MKRKILTLLLAALLLVSVLPASASADGSAVTVLFSFSDNAAYLTGEGNGQVMALKEITVPYFDLALYGLENFYFRSETYSSGSGVKPGTAETARNKVTMLHLFIYVTEVYYLGIDPENAGKGYLKTSGNLGSNALRITGSAGSLYIQMLCGLNYNLNYYRNYSYPLAARGWGSTCDQILLRDADVITVGHFSYPSFSMDVKRGRFHHLEPASSSVTQGETLELVAYRDGASGNYDTGHYRVDYTPDIYCCPVSELQTGDVTQWVYVGTVNAEGSLTVDTAELDPGTYLFAMPGQYADPSVTEEKVITSAPGAAYVTIREPGDKSLPGDLTDDGRLSALDASLVYRSIMTGFALTQPQLAAADVSGDGRITAVDAALIYRKVNNSLNQFPVE